MPLPPESFIHYVLETQNWGVHIRVLVNGVEIVQGAPADKKITQEMINGWLVAGENRLQIDASMAQPPKSVPQAHIKCLLFRGPKGRQPEESEALLHFEQDDESKLPTSLQTIWQQTFKPDPFYGPWVWESSRPIVPGSATSEAALGVIRSVIAALNAHSSEQVLTLFRIYIDEISRAYNRKPERMEDELKGQAATWVARSGPPLTTKDFLFTVEGNQRLLRVERKDGLSILTVDPKTPDNGPKRLYLTDAAMGWAIVR